MQSFEIFPHMGTSLKESTFPVFHGPPHLFFVVKVTIGSCLAFWVTATVGSVTDGTLDIRIPIHGFFFIFCLLNLGRWWKATLGICCHGSWWSWIARKVFTVKVIRVFFVLGWQFPSWFILFVSTLLEMFFFIDGKMVNELLETLWMNLFLIGQVSLPFGQQVNVRSHHERNGSSVNFQMGRVRQKVITDHHTHEYKVIDDAVQVIISNLIRKLAELNGQQLTQRSQLQQFKIMTSVFHHVLLFAVLVTAPTRHDD
mmetsp:Transcript_14180/g.34424  ORF Transcript_14180/g.34424 Transcript_14180/m.34424 type:complete len:256 (+) Transcript_14180:671-1438(+)